LKVIKGNVLDVDSLKNAITGQDVVLCALGHKRWLYPTKILSEGIKNIIDSMVENRVKRLICETSLGLGNSIGKMGLYYTFFVIPFILPFYFWDKRKQEFIIQSSELDWTIIRPGALNNRQARGDYRRGLKIGNWFYTVRISRTDVADFMLNQIEEKKPEYVGKLFVHYNKSINRTFQRDGNCRVCSSASCKAGYLNRYVAEGD